MTLPPARKPKPKPFSPEPLLRRFGIAVVVSPDDARAVSFGPASGLPAAKPRALSLPLFDPPKRLSNWRLSNRRYTAAHATPRILLPGIMQPHALPPPPSREDPIDATRLGFRLASLAAALDDLPAQARRYARWKAFNDRRRNAGGCGRVSALRPGRPPGCRLSRFDPSALPRRNIRDVDEVLAHAHALALYALQYPDTS